MESIFLSPHFYPPWNWGEAVATRNFALALRSAGVNVSIITSLNYNHLKHIKLSKSIFPIYVTDLKNSFIYSLYAMKVALDKALYSKPDVIVIHVIGLKDVSILFNLLYKKYKNILHNSLYNKSMIVFHDYGAIPGNIPFYGQGALGLFIKNLVGYTITTSYVRFYQYGKNRKWKKITYIALPYVPSSRIYEYGLDSNEDGFLQGSILEKELDHSRLITYIGHLRPERFPFMSILKAFQKVIKRGFNEARLLIIAPYDKQNIAIAHLIQTVIQKLGLEKYVIINVRNLNEKSKSLVFKKSNFFLFLPRKEPQSMDPPVSVIEAMAHGRVVIATNYQSLPYIINPPYRGIILRKEFTWQELEGTLTKLLKDDNKLVEEISYNAKNYIYKKHLYTVVGKHLIELFNNIVNE